MNLGYFLVTKGVNKVRLIDKKVSISKKKVRKVDIEGEEGKKVKK